MMMINSVHKKNRYWKEQEKKGYKTEREATRIMKRLALLLAEKGKKDNSNNKKINNEGEKKGNTTLRQKKGPD